MLTKEELYLVKSSLKLEYFSNISRDTSLEKDIMLDQCWERDGKDMSENYLVEQTELTLWELIYWQSIAVHTESLFIKSPTLVKCKRTVQVMYNRLSTCNGAIGRASD